MIEEGEIFIFNMHISPYKYGNIFNGDPLRQRKLLMHKKEIYNMHGSVVKKGFSIIPISLYFKNSKVKVKVGLCKGKKIYDKRYSIAKKEANRKIERNIKQQYKF